MTDKTVKTYSVWLDLVRGLAATTVFLGHARVLFIGSFLDAVNIGATTPFATQGTAPEIPTTNPGHVAVIVFFVLSGYLVGGGIIRALRAGSWSTSHYAIQRISRLWTVLIPVLILGYFLDHAGMAWFGPDSIYGAPSAQQIVFPDLLERASIHNLLINVVFLQGIFGETFGTNSPLWTLTYEFWFYVAFPFLAFAVLETSSTVQRMICVLSLCAIAVFVGSEICLYFLFWLTGASLELLPRVLQPKTAGSAAAVVGPMFAGLCLVLIKSDLHIYISDVIESFGFAVLCYLIIHLRKERPISLFSRLSGSISAMSYTLYLIHAPVLVFVSGLLMPVWRRWPMNQEGVLKFGLTTGAVFLLAAGIYWLFERNTPRVRKWMTRALDGVTKTFRLPA